MYVKLTFPELSFLPVFGKSGVFRGLSKEFKDAKEVARCPKSLNEVQFP